MIKAAIFDMDGVVLDSMFIWYDLGIRYLKSFGLTPEEGLEETLYPMSLEQGADYLISHYALSKTQQEVCEDLCGLIEDFYFDEVQLKPGAKEVIEFLRAKGARLAIATSSARAHVERALARLGVYENFECMFTTSEVGESKHSPKVFSLAAEALDAMPCETLVFEDSLYALQTAKNAGFITVGVRDLYGEQNQESLANDSELYLENLQDFIKLQSFIK